MSWALRLRTAVLGGALGAVGGAGFVAALPAADLVAPVGVAAAVGAVSAGLRRPNGPEALQLLGFAALVGLGAAVALGSAPTVLFEAWGPEGWPAIRDSPAPAPPTPEALAVPYLVTSVAAYLGTSLALRSRWGALAWSPSLVALVVGYVLGDEWQASSLWVPAGWAALVLLSTRERPDPGARRPSLAPDLATTVAGAALVALIVAAAIPLGGRLPLSSDRWILSRAAVPAPTESEHPLVTVVRLRNGPEEVLFTAETTAPVLRWRLTVLDEYDGQRWASSQRFRPAASDLPPPPDGTPRGGSGVDQHIELNLPTGSDEMAWGRWLPAADGVLATSEDGLLFDAGTTVLLAPEGELPARYDATSAGASTGDDLRANAGAATDDSARAASQLPDDSELLEELVVLADEVTAGATSDYARAVAIQSHLLGNGELLVADQAPGGHTVRHIHDFLLAENLVGDGELYGTAEQFATAFALLARAAELPARVVVGFEGSGTTGRQEVTAQDATAWVELRFDDLGWIPFDAVPDPTSDVLPPPPPPPAQDDSDEPAPADQSAEETTGDEEKVADDSDSERTTPWSGRAGAFPWDAASVVVALFGLLLLSGPGIRRALRRRRRRRAASPSGQIAGAWAMVVEDIRASGLTVRHAMPVTQVARLAAGQVPAQSNRISELGALANRSAFGRRPLEEADAVQAWVLSTTIVAARRSTRSLRQRLREYFVWRL